MTTAATKKTREKIVYELFDNETKKSRLIEGQTKAQVARFATRKRFEITAARPRRVADLYADGVRMEYVDAETGAEDDGESQGGSS